MNTQTQEALKMAKQWFFENSHKLNGDLAWKVMQKIEEALEQPAQAITEGSQLSNIKAGSQSEKPSSPPAPKHTCTYSRTMNQEYPRKCIHCGEVEALAQPQPKLFLDLSNSNGNHPVQPAQEPVMNVTLSCGCKSSELGFPSEWAGETRECEPCINYGMLCIKHFYEWDARPAQIHPAPSWQGLTDDDVENILNNSVYCEIDAKPFARAIEQALKEKNHA